MLVGRAGNVDNNGAPPDATDAGKGLGTALRLALNTKAQRSGTMVFVR